MIIAALHSFVNGMDMGFFQSRSASAPFSDRVRLKALLQGSQMH